MTLETVGFTFKMLLIGKRNGYDLHYICRKVSFLLEKEIIAGDD